MKVRASLCLGLAQPWETREIEIDEPHAHEVTVSMSYAGMCHSDEHLRTGDIAATPEILEMFGLASMFPVIGGHEGAGVVEAVGPEVNGFAAGDHVAMSFIPSCGTCHWCASGRQHLCDLGMYTLCGPMFSDFTWRHHFEGTPCNRMTQLGTFSEKIVVNEASLIKIDPEASLKAAALISCGISTGFGSAVDRAKVAPGEVVVVIGATIALLRSRWGLALRAIHHNELAARSNGVEVTRIKLLVYMVAGFGTAMAGALISLQKLRISPDAAFSVNDWTAFVIFMAVIGGVGRIEGPIIGAIVFFILRQTLSDLGSLYLMMLGLVAIVIMLRAPRGVAGWLHDRFGFDPIPLERRVTYSPSTKREPNHV